MKGSWHRIKKVWNGNAPPPSHAFEVGRPPPGVTPFPGAPPLQRRSSLDSVPTTSDGSVAQGAAAPIPVAGLNERLALSEGASHLDSPEAADSPASAEGSPGNSGPQAPKGPRNVCAICLERNKQGRGQALFTAECGHVFHFHCITANVRYGHVACPLCRVAWKEVPWAAPQGRQMALPHAATGAWAGPMSNRFLAASPLAPSGSEGGGGGNGEGAPPDLPGSGTTYRGSRVGGSVGGSFQDQPHMRGRHRQLDQTILNGMFAGPAQPLTPPPQEPSVYNDDEKVEVATPGIAPEVPSWQELKLSVCAEGTAAPYEEVRACYTVLLTIRAPPQQPPLEEMSFFSASTPALGAPGGGADVAPPPPVTSALTEEGDGCDLDDVDVDDVYRDRVPIDLVAALDMSGSMAGSKLRLLQDAIKFVIQTLGPNDRISIVAFSTQAWRVMGLNRMTPAGKEAAVAAVEALVPRGGTNIAEGLLKSIRILEERSTSNAVAAIMLLSDGQDTTMAISYGFSNRRGNCEMDYRRLLPARCLKGCGRGGQRFPVHTFGFGTDHDAGAMHTIAEETGGVFSFVEAEDAVQDAFAQCIGGLLSVVVQDVKLSFAVVQSGMKIEAVHSGAYEQTLTRESSEGAVRLGDLYACEERNILVELWLPRLKNREEEAASESLDGRIFRARCSYHVRPLFHHLLRTPTEELRIGGQLGGSEPSLAVGRQRNRLRTAICITQASELAERGDLAGAQKALQTTREEVAASAAASSGDELSAALTEELREIEMRMASTEVYQQSGRAFALSSKSSHQRQRATTRGDSVEAFSKDYQTPSMVGMLSLSRASNAASTSIRRPKPFVAKQMFNVFSALSSPTSPALSSDSAVASPRRPFPHQPLPLVSFAGSPLSGGAGSGPSSGAGGEAVVGGRKALAIVNGLNGPRPSPLALAMPVRAAVPLALQTQVGVKSPCRSPVVQMSPKRQAPQASSRAYVV